MDFKSILNEIPIMTAESEKSPVSFEQVLSSLPECNAKDPIVWCLFLHMRPDIQGQDRLDCLEIIKRLGENEKVTYGKYFSGE